jgi:PAS domain S-box-containing protein
MAPVAEMASYGDAVDKQPSTAVSPARGPTGDFVAQSMLHVTDEIVAGMLDAAPDGLLLVDGRGRMALVNDRVEEMFGYGRDDLVGQAVEVLLPEAFRQVHVAHRQRFLAQPRTRPMGAGLSLSGRRKDGSEFAVEVSLSTLSSGGERWVVAGIRDATERLEIERQRRQSAVIAEQSRIAEDLAETVIHGLFGTGLKLQTLLDSANDEVIGGLAAAIENIDRTIRAIRTAVFGLTPEEKDRDDE